ncbi:Ribosome maturation factor rimP [Gluconacetobacter sp. SXCC-1]|nr:ribosome maturation factor RimP [Komagataeibacter xylinus]EGG78183.1 Ribosome maturation factor rimP [Gluconacetobacter sp. SXCC-1]
MGGGRRAAFFALDADLPFLTGLDARIAAMVAPALADMGFDLVRVAVLGRESPTVQIMADRADGTLIAIEDCEQISHAVGAILDVEDPLPGAWTLEVSSAGIDRPLTRAKDWERFAGHLARAEMNMPIEGRKRFAGIVLGARDGHGLMRLDDGTEVALPFAEMRKARLVLTDELIEASARMMRPAASSKENGSDEAQAGADAAVGDVPPADTRKPGARSGRKPARKAN